MGTVQSRVSAKQHNPGDTVTPVRPWSP